ncbi:MAG: tRNA dihydrouridine(20/20a) synthase DusA [Thiomicrospira sp.]
MLQNHDAPQKAPIQPAPLIRQATGASGFAVAPMLDWTDKHCRVIYRLLTKQAWLYSEMVTTGAMIYGNNLARFIGRDERDAPVVLQLGGSNPNELARCAKLGQDWGYSAINLNVGCPSDRVQNNLMGACLMAHPQLVGDCVDAMKQAVDIPVTVKHRIGIDQQEDLATLLAFVAACEKRGVDGVIIHARKAWLKGLSPKENREIPPLNYPWVHQVKQAFANLDVMINGGIKTPEDGLVHLNDYAGFPAVDGVMLGRAIYEQPYLLAQVDRLYYGGNSTAPTREALLQQLYPYIEQHLQQGGRVSHITRHMMGLFHGMPGGRLWRRYLSEHAGRADAGVEVVETAYQLVKQAIAQQEARDALS